jgi:hypothetical protein
VYFATDPLQQCNLCFTEQNYFTSKSNRVKTAVPFGSLCHKHCLIDDTAQEPRWFEFVPLWNIAVWFAYRMRRVTCPEHGVVVEGVPWCDGKCTQTPISINL